MTEAWVLILILFGPPTVVSAVAEYTTVGDCVKVMVKVDLAGLGRVTCIRKTRKE